MKRRGGAAYRPSNASAAPCSAWSSAPPIAAATMQETMLSESCLRSTPRHSAAIAGNATKETPYGRFPIPSSRTPHQTAETIAGPAPRRIA